MKTFGKFEFGIQAVQAGQKTAYTKAEPQLIVSCTTGKFVVTSPVSKALDVAAGENIMFLNNIAGVEAAVRSRNSDVIAYANELGIDLNSRDGEDMLVNSLTQWFIAKGVPQYNPKGEPLMCSARYTKEDKAKYLEEHAMEVVELNREALVEQFGELSDEELATKLTIDMISFPKVQNYSGSKTAATGSATGVGCQLNFCDSAVWNTLKKDLGDEANKLNRVYDVLINEEQKADFNNGKENISITILPIAFKEDVEVTRKKAE